MKPTAGKHDALELDDGDGLGNGEGLETGEELGTGEEVGSGEEVGEGLGEGWCDGVDDDWESTRGLHAARA